VIEYYKKLNLLKVIDGERSIDQINKEISDIISLI
jgi:adenylate kinase family enzyme